MYCHGCRSRVGSDRLFARHSDLVRASAADKTDELSMCIIHNSCKSRKETEKTSEGAREIAYPALRHDCLLAAVPGEHSCTGCFPVRGGELVDVERLRWLACRKLYGHTHSRRSARTTWTVGGFYVPGVPCLELTQLDNHPRKFSRHRESRRRTRLRGVKRTRRGSEGLPWWIGYSWSSKSGTAFKDAKLDNEN